ncbi:hypothetical protein [Fibrobacter sp. UWB12]|uniref:hypothetical protein n=1 Tax=Fibrobacter sp. UWB12 TaxID=1896203 RepID=UPI0009165340|nr:hypothetical protein [Fibrobacter sp. UWB12]SHK61265.1 hypothetical protein SAMN05720759_104186 [Fibrobacter sp. UWB12]
MKIKYLLISVIACLLSVFSFAKSEQLAYYTVSTEKVTAYAQQNLLLDTVEVFKKLDSCKARYYDSKIEMADSIIAKLKDYPKYHKIVNNFIRASHMIRTKESLDALDMPDVLYMIGKLGVDSLKWYIVDDLESQMVFSEKAYKIIQQMEGIDFPDKQLAHRYAKNLLARSYGLCERSVDLESAGLNKKITDEDFFRGKKKHIVDSLKNAASVKCENSKIKDYDECIEKSFSLNLIKRKIEKSIVPEIEREEKFLKRYSGRICSDDLWKNAFSGLDLLYSLHLSEVVDSALVETVGFDDNHPVDMNGKSCGCSHKEELNGEVIGFYPYWYAGDTTKWVDFEGVTRLAYYGLKVNGDGSLATPSGKSALMHFDKEENYEFVNDVHRHNVKLDWIVSKDEWKGVILKNFFDNLIVEIDSLLNTKTNSYFQRFVNAFTFYTDEYENRGDGVTLYFKNFPKDESSTSLFNDFFDSLKNRLAQKNEYVHVNLMMDRSDLAIDKNQLFADSVIQESHSGIYSYNNFLTLLKGHYHDRKVSRKQIREEVKNYLFVVLDEPASRNKQILLNDLNLQLDSLNRRNMLHSLVPVVWFDNVGWSQFSKDALYYNDTYYNLGVGPYATDLNAEETCATSGNLGACMLKHFENEDGDGLRQGAIASFFCTHRWVFRFLNIITFLIAIAVLVAYFTSFRVSDFFNSNLALLLGIVVAPSAVMMTIISRLDPSVAAYRGTFGLIPILLLLVTVIAIILLQVYRKNDLPKRRKK